ncbi:MAG: chemotaxis response regulator protein-glutamate methylesterase [Planctomycetota bacterium]|nr:chemotaxis response regulator protein-glutamate methylesterase [Planctomycetota bacterium]
MKLKVMVVDDSALYRQLVKNVLRNLAEVEVIGLACTGKEALEKIPELQPDLLTLDVQMPDMNGLELLREIKRRRLPVKAIMISSLTAQGAQVTTDALLAGAFDFIQKPNSPDANSNRLQLEALLADKISAFQQSRSVSMPTRIANNALSRPVESLSVDAQSVRASALRHEPKSGRMEAVLIGTSTGGPLALRELIPKLPADLGVPVFVVQHMPPKYTQSLAARIGEVSQIAVHEAVHGMKVEANHVYIAPGGLHMGIQLIGGKPVIRTSEEPPEHNCRPSVDFTFRAACSVYAGNLLGVILTGMGRDGTEGCRMIKQLGGKVLAQHPDGCIVYGMPKVVVEEQLADRVVPIDKMASWIIRIVDRSRH